MLPKVEMVTKQQAQAQATCISHDQPACAEYSVEVPCPVAHYDSFFFRFVVRISSMGVICDLKDRSGISV